MHSMGDDDPSDAGLALGLGLHSWEPPHREKRQPPATRSSSPAPAADPSLTLTLSDDACPLSTVQQSSPRSWSSKREKELGSEEEEEGNAKKKLRLNKDQSALLEAMFKEHSTLNPTQKQALARKLNLRPRQVEVWFQNRRARTKLKQTEVDCEHLRNYCERLADENRRLQKELHELKAHNTYVSTVSMCPSCERKIGGDIAQEGGAASFLVRPKSHFCGPFATSHPPSAAC